ncbi:arylamine N-acetyltransferase 1 [Roridomyces roridus]|uniref:Arylamine N-acetyltransferase 1 n=1 Tax=Roridomyces roridus TaxID=1738132 RepID=A0AAD7FGC5_9AGAR|nr:arylamine N-acetyltransferase 1 [Roridomyces roridus]
MSYPTYPPDAFAQTTLNRQDAAAYLDRINLPASLLDSPPSLELLSTVFLAHLEQIPKDTSPLHVPESQWSGPSTPVNLGSALADGMPLGSRAFDRIVHEHKGAYCFAINATFAGLLRTFGFTVSELGARACRSLGNDPLTHADGWYWGTLTHEVLVAGWEGSADRYLVDAAWGPWNLALPIKLTTDPAGETILGLNEFEAYRLVFEELPVSPNRVKPLDVIPGYTLYRRIAPVGTPHTLPITPNSPGYWSPIFHFHLSSLGLSDFMLLNHFSATHGLATFTPFWLVTRLIPGGKGARRSMMYAEKAGDEARRAKVYTTGGPEAQGSDEGRDVEWVDMETGPLKEYLSRELGYKF